MGGYRPVLPLVLYKPTYPEQLPTVGHLQGSPGSVGLFTSLGRVLVTPDWLFPLLPDTKVPPTH